MIAGKTRKGVMHMVETENKYVTVVSVESNLNDIPLGEKVFVRHEQGNSFDPYALKVFVARTGQDIGYVSRSPHTMVKGSVPNHEIISYILSPEVPLVGKVVRKANVNFRNGDISPALVLEVQVISTKKAV